MRKLIGIIAVVILIGCSGQNGRNDADDNLYVNIDIENLCNDAGEFFDSYRYVILETDSVALIGDIGRIDMDSFHIVLSTGENILVYDNDGKLVSAFEHYGQGPQEYLKISDLKIHDNEIYVLSSSSKTILRYSMQGDYIATYKLPDYYTEFTFVDGKIWLASKNANSSRFEFSEYDTDNQEIGRRVLPFESNEDFIDAVLRSFPLKDGSLLYVTRPFDLTLYTLDTTTGDIEEKWKFHFNTEMQLSDFPDGTSFVDLYKGTSNKPVVTRIGAFELTQSSAYIMASVFCEIGYFPNIYKFDRHNPAEPGKLMRLGLESYKEFPFLKSSPRLIYNHEYVSDLDAAIVLTVAEHYGITEFADKGLTEESNPVLFFHRFK